MATSGPVGTGGAGGAYDPRYDPAFQRGFDGRAGEAGGNAARPPAPPAADALAPGDTRGTAGIPGNAGTTARAPVRDPAAAGEPRGRPAEPAVVHPTGTGESSWFSGTGSAFAEVTSPAPQPEESAAEATADERVAARAHAHRMWTAYTVCLSALSAACMAFGVVLVTRAYGVFNSTTVDSRDDIYWAQLGGQFGPWVFVVGLATGIGVIFLHAAQWRPPHD